MPSEPEPSSDLYADLLGLPAPRLPPAPETLAHELQAAASGYAESLLGHLAPAGFQDPAAALQTVLGLAQDPFARDRFLHILPHLLLLLPRSADPDMALRNLDRFARVVLDRALLYGQLRQHPVLLRFLLDLFAFSQFLSDILIRNPEYFEWLLSPACLSEDRSAEDYRQSLAQAVSPFRKPESIRRAVCRWKRRQLLRIGVRDMLGKADIRQCARELTGLAEAVICYATDASRAECEERFGIPRSEYDPETGAPVPFAVYGMGKLGGSDLNFSSDIDLIFLYGEEGRTTGIQDRVGSTVGRITNHEFFSRMGERIIAFLSEPSEEGLLFRVDMRLRPEGTSGPLVRSLASYSMYFNDQARAWEKVAYLKARKVAGDDNLARTFDESIRHFVFSGNEPRSLAAEIASLKTRIDHEALDAAGRERDIKRGLGGIREIEFIAVHHQLIEGQRDSDLQTRDTVESLERLGRRDNLPRDDCRFLAAAYAFFRRLEHRLQMMAERQTYLLPDTLDEWGRLARRSGYLEGPREEAGARLRDAYGDVSRRVRALFERDFGIERQTSAAQADPVTLLLHPAGEMGAQQARHLLEQRGFRDPASTLSALQGLAFGSDQRAVSSAGQRWFERILPSILDLAAQLPFPDEAVRHLDGFLTATKGRTLVYELLAGHPSILRMLLFAFASGPVLSRSLIAHPEWFDELLETGAASPGYDVAGQESRMVDQVLSARDDESAWRRLRMWKEKTSLILGLLEVLNLEPEESLARKTSDLAEICLRAIAIRIERNLARGLGNPTVESPSTGTPISWCILGLGGFGGRHVSHFSDLDIVLLFSEDGRVPRTGMRAVEWFSRLGEELIGVMTAVSPEGQLFKVDARLRPEGRNAPLAAPLERYVIYYETSAQTWEWQAILKARVIAGDEALATRFLQALWDFLPRRFSDQAALAEEIAAMRERLAQSVKVPRWAETDYKRGRGGLVDVDFILQFVQLASMARETDSAARTRLAQPVVEEAVPILIEVGALEESEGRALLNEHEFLRTLQRRQRLLFETAKDLFPEKAERLDPLRRALVTFLQKVDLVERFHESRNRLRGVFERLVQ